MSGLTVQGLNRFAQYFDPVSNFSNDTGEDLTSVSQIKNTHDPFGLRQRYASSRQDVIDTLDKIDAALANFNPYEGKYLDLNGIDFTPLNDLKVNRYETLNLERLLVASQNVSQYPLYRANLSDAILTGVDLYGANLERANLERANLRMADLREAFALVDCQRVGGKILRNYLVSEFNVVIDGGTKF